MDLNLEWGSNWIDFSTGVEISLVFVWGVEFDLVSVLESKVICFFVRGIEIDRVRAEINLVLVWWSMGLFFVWVVVVEIDSIYNAGRKSLGFSVSIKLDLVSVWLVDIDLISVSGIELDFIRDRNRFVSCLGVENYFVLPSGSYLPWILCDDVRPQIMWSLDR